jgi:hypothetical protein
MTRRGLLALAAGGAAARAQNGDDRMGAAWDLLYQALEMLSAHAGAAEVTRAMGFLKRALDQYASFGDAHYYRALCLARLKTDTAAQGRELDAARRYNSEALRDRRDPFTLAVPKLHENLIDVGQKWALVVGISQFQPDAGAESLGFAASDATALAELLRDPEAGRFAPNQVFALTDAQATTANIKARLNTIASKAKPEDIVMVYLSTHGSPRADDLRDVSYLYTYDTDVTSRDRIFGTALPMVEVSGIVSTRCVAQRTVVVLDTCHSGASAAGQAAGQGDFDRLREGAGRYIISSCEADQKSYEIAGHGYFTASLIARWRERKGCIRLNDLFARVQKDVSETVMKKHNRAQRPVMAKSDNAAEIVLGAAAGGACAV